MTRKSNPTMLLLAALFVVVTSVFMTSGESLGDDQEADAAAADTSEQEESFARADQSIGGMILSGGALNVVFFGVLGVFSIWAATVVLERCVNLRREKLLPTAFTSGLQQMIRAGQATPESYQLLCEQTPAPVGRIFHAGVLRAGRSLPEVEKAMEDAASREMANLRSRNRPLNVVASVAPLVGLLGTVVGMILAFQISSQEGLGKAERLAEGIYLALMTTAAGLSIAIPCLLFASWFKTRAERFMCDIDETLMEAMPSFARWEGSVQSKFVVSQPAPEEEGEVVAATVGQP